MSIHHPPPPPSLGISLLLFLVLLLLIPCTDAVVTVKNTSIPGCPSVDCGNGVNITYPFWASDGSSSSYCGYYGLGLFCNQDESTVLRLPNDNYSVTHIDYPGRIIHLADMDVLGGSNCPRARHNLSLVDSIPLASGGANANLAFFFNCSEAPPAVDGIPCLNYETNRSYVAPQDAIPVGYNWQGVCEDMVVAPVLRQSVPASISNLIPGFGNILKEGFQLNWTTPNMADCNSCESTAGRCGYDNTPGGFVYSCFCADGRHTRNCKDGRGINYKVKVILGIAAILVGIILMCLIFFLYRRCKKLRCSVLFWKKSNTTQIVEAFLEGYGSLAPKRYKYLDVKKITKSFSCKLGQGGFGMVFKGKFSDGRIVAVKVLSESKGNGEEFVNEVASIGRTYHVNIVNLLGFCSEGSKRALIYEFMPNGSLEKFIFAEKPTPLGWEKLYEIAIGIARGLEYLHRGCETHIVHFDIKPHNILLDQDFCPKISDFGLAKLCRPRESILSTIGARGTIGYIAPEVFCRNIGVISSKSDVYSYGMLVLEMVGGRRNIHAYADNTSEIYFPHWIYEHFDQDVDHIARGVTKETEEIVRKMILVGLWCIQTDPKSRPSMSRVVEMLGGSIKEIQMPPKPYLSSPVRSYLNSSTQALS